MSSKQPGSPPLRFEKSASYDLSFSGSKTSSKRLEYYLNVASDFGLARQGATVQNLLPLLPPPSPGADDLGPITADYQVRYTRDALQRLFGAPIDETTVRQIAREVVLANYVRDTGLEEIGWCYWTQGIYDDWKNGQAAFTNHARLSFTPIAKSPFPELPAPSAQS